MDRAFVGVQLKDRAFVRVFDGQSFCRSVAVGQSLCQSVAGGQSFGRSVAGGQSFCRSVVDGRSFCQPVVGGQSFCQRVVDTQYCIGFCCPAKSIGHTHTPVSTLLQSPFSCMSLQSLEESALGYAVHTSYILIYGSVYRSVLVSQFYPLTPCAFLPGHHKSLFFTSVTPFMF